MKVVHPRDIDVLVVDDEEELGADIRFFLERNRLKPFVTTDPHAALKRLANHDRPFVLLSDLKMPNMSGIELLEAVKKEVGAERDHAAILFSGFADVDRAIAALRLGVLDFLVKPFDLDHLWRALQRAFDQIEMKIIARERSNIDLLTETLLQARDVTGRLENAVGRISNGAKEGDAGSARSRAEKRAWSDHLLESNDWLIRAIKWHQSLRRLRDRIFPPCACDDGAWEIILYVLEQYLLQRPAPVTSACHATSIPQTTANRKVEELVECGMLLKHADRIDRRRTLLVPTDTCVAQGEEYFRSAIREIEGMMGPGAAPQGATCMGAKALEAGDA